MLSKLWKPGCLSFVGLASLKRFRDDTQGGVLVYTALTLPILLGISGLSVDVGLWYTNKRVTQAAADSAALSGALAIHRMGDDTNLMSAATEGAAANGYDGAGGDVLTVNSPPNSGTYAGQAGAVEVILERPGGRFLSSLVFDNTVTIAARAVAVAGTKDTCIWALDPAASGAIKVSGGATINMNCGIMANSVDPDALKQSGGGCINATYVAMSGGYDGDCINPTPHAANPVADPLAGLEPPSFSGCDLTGNFQVKNGDNEVLPPPGEGGTGQAYVICGKVTVASGGSLTFEPGTYVLDGAALTVHGDVTGNGVNFYLTEDMGQNDNITINSGANVDLVAGTSSGTLMDGVLFFQDRNAPEGINHQFTGQANMQLNGIIYMPNADLDFAGGSASSQNTAAIIARTINFTGGSEFADLTSSPTFRSPLLTKVSLVE